MPAHDLHPVAGSPFTAVLLHPHPQFGGDRFNHVIDALYASLPGAGISVLRFDFGSGDVAVARKETLTAIDSASADPVVLVGYSFGADIALGTDDRRVAGWFLVAPPLRLVDPSAVAADSRAKALLVPEHDQYSSPARAREVTADWTNTTVTVLAGADHFLASRSAAVVEAATAWIAELQRGR